MVLVYGFGPVSGAHFNPAVTLGVKISKPDFSNTDTGMYIIMQILGALLAASFWFNVIGHTDPINSFTIGPKGEFDVWSALATECLFTCFLVFCVLNTALARANAGNEYYGLCIGFAVVSGGYAAGPISGAVLNPAIGIGAGIITSNSVSSSFFLQYALAQLAGGCIAALLYRVVRPEEYRAANDADGLGARLCAEFIGCYFLCCVVGCNVLAVAGGNAMTPVSIAAALLCIIYAIGTSSGGHVNPAVTIGIALSGRGKIATVEACYYILAHLLAGFASAMTVGAITESAVNEDGDTVTFTLGARCLASGDDRICFGWGHVFAVEAIFTAILVWAVLTVATSKQSLSTLHGLVIGFAVIVGTYTFKRF